jgi:hypothetical protein
MIENLRRIFEARSTQRYIGRHRMVGGLSILTMPTRRAGRPPTE